MQPDAMKPQLAGGCLVLIGGRVGVDHLAINLGDAPCDKSQKQGRDQNPQAVPPPPSLTGFDLQG